MIYMRQQGTANLIEYQEIETTLHNLDRKHVFNEIRSLLINYQELTATRRKGGGFLMGRGKMIASQYTN
jgi:hypothetical protein